MRLRDSELRDGNLGLDGKELQLQTDGKGSAPAMEPFLTQDLLAVGLTSATAFRRAYVASLKRYNRGCCHFFSGTMPMTDVTRILSAIEQSDPMAAEKLLPLVYDKLRLMLGVFLPLLCCLTCGTPTTVFAEDIIKPQHSIKCPGGGWSQLSRDGRWFAHMYVEKRDSRSARLSSPRPVRLFDLNQQPADEFSTQERLLSGTIYGFERWFVDFASPLHSDSKNLGPRVWDLTDTSGLPSLVLGSGNGYSSAKVNAAGTHVAAVHKNAEGFTTLRLWDLRKSKLQVGDCRTLGVVVGRVSNSQFKFTTGLGIIAVTDDGLTRWGLDALDKPPVTLPLDEGVNRVQTAHDYWQGGTSNSWGSVQWKGTSGTTFVTDLPENPTDYHVWELKGRLVTFDGSYAVEAREDECWLTRIDGTSTSSTKLFGSANNSYDTVFVFGKNKYLLVSNTKWIPVLDGVAEVRTRVFSLPDPKAPPVILEDYHLDSMPKGRGLYEFLCSYVKTTAGKWLIGRSKVKTTVWNLLKPLSAEGTGELSGIEGKTRSHFLADDRWLIVVGEDRRLYFVDMNAETTPRATEFFRLEPSKQWTFSRFGAGGGRVFALDYTAGIAHIWDVAQFERVSLQR